MKHKTAQSIASYYNKESSSATEFRRIYSSILSSKGDKKPQTILVTSAIVGEGKSLTSSLLSITAASLTGSKIAVVDFDLRRPRLHEYFAIPPGPGVVEVLSGKSNIKSVTRNSGIPNLSIITSGKPTLPPSEIFDRADIPGFLQELKFYFDTVIIDSPPIIPVSDPMLIADQVDGVIVVVKGGSTQREVARRALNLLEKSAVNLLGIILNDQDSVLPYYYKDRYYGYQYGYSRKK
ncbi:MAG: CpsD/CapB family tyrosine-protein kinase [candidate division Zixibacteria bacterium]